MDVASGLGMTRDPRNALRLLLRRFNQRGIIAAGPALGLDGDRGLQALEPEEVRPRPGSGSLYVFEVVVVEHELADVEEIMGEELGLGLPEEEADRALLRRRKPRVTS